MLPSPLVHTGKVKKVSRHLAGQASACNLRVIDLRAGATGKCKLINTVKDNRPSRVRWKLPVTDLVTPGQMQLTY